MVRVVVKNLWLDFEYIVKIELEKIYVRYKRKG